MRVRALVPAPRFQRPGLGGFPSQSKRGGRSADRRWWGTPHPWPASRSGRSRVRPRSPANDAGRRASRRSTAALVRRRAALSTGGGWVFAQAPRPSASSWQGAVVPPGGAPTPPECVVCETTPAGAAPAEARDFPPAPATDGDRPVLRPLLSVRPASTTPREAPLSGRGCPEYSPTRMDVKIAG
jgi:hypothetical protein